MELVSLRLTLTLPLPVAGRGVRFFTPDILSAVPILHAPPVQQQLSVTANKLHFVVIASNHLNYSPLPFRLFRRRERYQHQQPSSHHARSAKQLGVRNISSSHHSCNQAWRRYQFSAHGHEHDLNWAVSTFPCLT